LLGLAGYLGVIAWWVTGTRIRLTADGVETRMGPRRSYRWLDVPDLKVEHTNIVVLRAAGAPRPRVWLRTGVLEVATGTASGWCGSCGAGEQSAPTPARLPG